MERELIVCIRGRGVGGFTLRMEAQERVQYDEYTGILCYNELE